MSESVDKVFVYLRLMLGETELTRSKIREIAGLGTLLAQFLHRTLAEGVDPPPEADPADPQVPALDYVDANTEEVLIRCRVDPDEQVQVMEGRIPPSYQERMLSPDATVVSRRFSEAEGEEDSRDSKGDRDSRGDRERRALAVRLAESQIEHLGRIRESLDEEGRFRLAVPLP